MPHTQTHAHIRSFSVVRVYVYVNCPEVNLTIICCLIALTQRKSSRSVRSFEVVSMEYMECIYDEEDNTIYIEKIYIQIFEYIYLYKRHSNASESVYCANDLSLLQLNVYTYSIHEIMRINRLGYLARTLDIAIGFYWNLG